MADMVKCHICRFTGFLLPTPTRRVDDEIIRNWECSRCGNIVETEVQIVGLPSFGRKEGKSSGGHV